MVLAQQGPSAVQVSVMARMMVVVAVVGMMMRKRLRMQLSMQLTCGRWYLPNKDPVQCRFLHDVVFGVMARMMVMVVVLGMMLRTMMRMMMMVVMRMMVIMVHITFGSVAEDNDFQLFSRRGDKFLIKVDDSKPRV